MTCNILIAAVTVFDSKQLALSRIMSEWTSNGSFQDRVNNIRNGTGSLAGTGVKLEGNFTDDASEDVLTGSQADDWFIWNSDDRATDLKDKAFEGDLNWILNA